MLQHEISYFSNPFSGKQHQNLFTSEIAPLPESVYDKKTRI